jgi:hypothetical protein
MTGKHDDPKPGAGAPPHSASEPSGPQQKAAGQPLPKAEDRDLTVSGTIRSPTQSEQAAYGAPGLTISGQHQTPPDDVVQPGGDPSQVSGYGNPEQNKPPLSEEQMAQVRQQAAAKTGQELPKIAGTDYTEDSVKEPAEKERNERWKKEEDARAKAAASHSNPADEHTNDSADHGAGHGNRPGQSGGSHGASGHTAGETQGSAKKK